MSGLWKWLCTIPLGLTLAAGTAAAQSGRPSGHQRPVHAAAVHHGGYYGGHHYYGGYGGGYWPGRSYSGFGIGIGFGSPYYGSPYFGGVPYPYGYGSYGLGSYALMPVYPAVPAVPAAVPVYPEPAPRPAGPAPAPQPAASGPPAPATVSVVVPAGAELWFNDKPQPAGTGPFVSDPIPPGQTATLEVRAKWDGSTRSMRIPLRAGEKMTVDLTRR
jgi:hypothetical protein